MVLVTVRNGDRSKAFKVETAAGLIPAARAVFGEGYIMDPQDVAEYGQLEECEYTWSSFGEN